MESQRDRSFAVEPRTSRVGIDIGRVIIAAGREDDRQDTSFIGGSEEDALKTPPVPEAFETIRLISAQVDGRVWLVSKCGPRIQQRTRRWLAHWRFFEETLVPPENLRFCLQRPEKSGIAAGLGLSHFIDDRVDVLVAMQGVVPGLILFGLRRPGESVPDGVHQAADWAGVAATLLGSEA